MPDAPILGATKKVVLDGDAFGARFSGQLVHESVRAELNARRQGTSSTKTRGKVSGGGAKPWRQKGTGRARAGSSRSPVWTGGGVVFGPQPRHFTFKVNRKERQAALRSALSIHAERGSIAVVDTAAFETPSTKAAIALLDGWADGGSILVILTEAQAHVALSFRNIARVSVLPSTETGVADIVGASRLLVSEDALGELSARAKGEPVAGEPTEEDA
ncbi:MAG TPA: 50S ribosomal protein L4 [Solirubrobacteraceae bacterium]